MNDVEDESAALGLKTLVKHAKGIISLHLALGNKFEFNCYTEFWIHPSDMHSTALYCLGIPIITVVYNCRNSEFNLQN